MSPRCLLSLMTLLAACETRADDPALDAGGRGLGSRDPGVRDARIEVESDAGGDASSATTDAAMTADAANAACADDLREPDNHPSGAERHDPIQGIVPVELTGLTACPQDEDLFWAGFVDAGGKASAVLTWDASLGELELSLGDADNMPMAHRDVSTASPGRAEERVDEYYDSYFYVRVKNPGPAGIPYTLTITAQVFGP